MIDAGWLRHLQTPWLLAAALVLPLLTVALVLAWARRRVRRAERLGERALVARLAPGVLDVGAGWRAARLGAATALAGVALAGPRWGAERTVVRSAGIDVVLALDASLSMLATDERPSRLERVKQEVRRLRALAPGDRTALVAFAGRSYILTPLTTDEGALALFLDALDPSVVGQAGSSLARALRQATDLLQGTRSGSDRAIVVMSDGEAFEPLADVEEAARQAAAAGISVVTVGFGTAAGATIPVRDGNAVTEKRDADGRVVVTRYMEEPLAAAARAAGGTFIPATATDKAARVRAALAGLRATRRASDAGRDLTPRFQLFLVPAFLLLVLDTVLGARRGAAPRRRAGAPPPGAAPGPSVGPGRAAALLLVLAPTAMLALGGCGALPGSGRTDPALVAFERGEHEAAIAAYRGRLRGGGTLLARYNLGTALVAADSTDASRAPLDEARRAPDPVVRWRAHFNLGLAHLLRGLAAPPDSARAELDVALQLYRRALLARPGDLDAKWNYELALRRREDEQRGGGGGGGGGGGAGSPPPQAPPEQQERPAGGLGRQQAEEILNAAARDERDVQGRKQRQAPPPPPPGGKDW